MTEFKFPDPQKIDWAGLKESDVVWIKATVEQAWAFYRHHREPLFGHVIKAPRPIAVGDTVSIVGRVPGHWVVLALDDDVAWLRHTKNPKRFRRESVLLAALVRVEP